MLSDSEDITNHDETLRAQSEFAATRRRAHYIMKVGTPQDVDNDTAEFFLKSVQMTTVESLRILWVQHNICEDVQARAVQGFA